MAEDPESLAEESFASYLERRDKGELTDLEAFIRSHAEPVQAPLRQLIENYESRKAEGAYLGYVERRQSGETINVELFILRHEEQIQAQLRRLITDYESLRIESPSAPTLEPLKFGDYLLQHELGRGASAAVWEAIELGLDRRVALKRLHPIFSFSNQALKRFLREARAAASLDHPGIIKVYATGEQDGLPFIAQELVPGGRTLASWLEDQRQKGPFGREHDRKVARLCALIADALQHAHQAGVVHRDLKPSNVLLTPEDMPKIADFGLALVVDDVTLTQSSSVVGTYAYMSPEQVQGHRKAVDQRSDIFALGTTLHELLTHRRPFREGSSLELRASICEDRLRDPRMFRTEVPPALAAICIRALRFEPNKRYQDMSALAADLRAFLDGKPVSALPPGRLQRAWYTMVEYPRLTAGAALIFTGLFTSLGLLAYVNEQRNQADFEAELSAELLLSRDELHLSEHPEQVRDRLGLLADQVRERLPGRQQTLALEKLAHSARKLGDTAMTISLLRETLAQHEAAGSEASSAALEDRRILGWCQTLELRFEEAATTFESGLELAEPGSLEGELLVAFYIDTLIQGRLEDRFLAYIREHGDPRERLAQLVERLKTELPGQRLLQVMVTVVEAAVLHRQNEIERARGLIKECLDYCETSLPLDDPLRLRVLVAWSTSLSYIFELDTQRPDKNMVGALFARATDALRTRYGPEHPVTALALFEQGRVFINEQDYEQAKPLYVEAQAGLSRLGPGHLYSLLMRQHLLVQKFAELEPLVLLAEVEELTRDFEQALGRQHTDTVNCLRLLALAKLSVGRFEEAHESLEEGLRRLTEERWALGQVRVEYPQLVMDLNELSRFMPRDFQVKSAGRAIALLDRKSEHLGSAVRVCLASVIEILFELGEYASISSLVGRHAEFVRQPTEPTAFEWLPLAYLRNGEEAAANQWMDQLVQLVETGGIPGSKRLAVLLETCRELDRPAHAEWLLGHVCGPLPDYELRYFAETADWSFQRKAWTEWRAERGRQIQLTREWLDSRGGGAPSVGLGTTPALSSDE